MQFITQSSQRAGKLVLSILISFALCASVACGGGSGSSSNSSGDSGSPLPQVSCGVSVANGILSVSSDNLQFSMKGSTIQSMKNLSTGETEIASPGSGVIDLNQQNPTGEMLAPGAWTTGQDPSTGATVATLSLSDSQRQVTMTAGCDAKTQEVFIRMAGHASEPGVRGLLWGVQGFDASGKFILPAHAGVYFDANSQSPTFSFAYPTHWEAQFVIYQHQSGGVLLYARDPRPFFKQVQGTREFGTLDLIFETFALGPWSTATEVPSVEWRLKGFRGNWKGAVDTYRSWSNAAFPSRSADPERDWTKNVDVVITVASPDTKYLDVVAQYLDPRKTLIYVVDWRKDQYDTNYPDYTPKPETAGFITYAHQLGFHVMLHTNVVGVATYNPVYTSLSQYQLRDPETRDLMYWPWGLWPGGTPPPDYFQSYAFMSAASSAYRKVFEQQVTSIMDTVHPDALHLDGGGVLLNDGNGLIEGMTSIDGMVELHKELAAQFPQLVFSYESMTEAVAGFHNFTQRWASTLPSHPVLAYLEGDHIQFYGFLNQPNPDDAGFIDYIRHYEPQGVMPTISLDENQADNPMAHLGDLETSEPITSTWLKVMKLWQQYDFRPDWNSDWSGKLFRYISADGKTTATVEDSDNKVSLKVAGETIYERATNTTTMNTSSYVANWTAYNSSTLFGLDPSLQYWLQNNISRPADSTHISNLPQDVLLGESTFNAGDYAYFELNNVAKPSYDFMLSFGSAKIGVASGNGLDYHLDYGAVVQITQTLVNGKLEQPIIVMHPPLGPYLGGATFAEYQVPIPAAPSYLNFHAGISDFGPLSDGVLMKVTVNGTQVWRQSVSLGQWIGAHIDLSQWAGTTAKIRFLVHPGNALNPIDDLAVWGQLGIETEPSSKPVNFDLLVPPQSTVSSSSGVQLSPTGDPTHYLASSTIPANFAIFTAMPPPVTVGGSLLNLPFKVWKRSYSGYPFEHKVEESGSIRDVVSGGVSKNALALYPADRSYTFGTWAVQLPLDATKLSFSFGLADPPPPLQSVPYTGVDFGVLINGDLVWHKLIQTAGWNDESIDLTPYRGQQVIITLQSDSNSSPLYDWANWAGLTIQ